MGTSILRIGVLKSWAGFAGAWATAAAIALALHAGGAGGLKLLEAGHSSGIAADSQRVAHSQALRVRIEASSPSKDLLRRSVIAPTAATEPPEPIAPIALIEESDTIHAPSSVAEPQDAGPEGVERCTNLSSLISRELWLEFRDYGILPRTYKVAYARHVDGVTQLVRFEPVNAGPLEYADRMLSGIMQRCMNDLRKLPSHGDLEVTFVIGDE